MISTSVVVTLYLICSLIAFALMIWVQRRDNGCLKENELTLLFALGLIWPLTLFTMLMELLADRINKL